MSTYTFEVRPNEAGGWDIMREDDPDAITNVATKEEAVKAAELLAAEADGARIVVREEPHELSDVGRGVKVYVIGLFVLLALIMIIIVVTALISSAFNI
jgi:Uncharacterized protein conserved in bacteria (DUF2188)